MEDFKGIRIKSQMIKKEDMFNTEDEAREKAKEIGCVSQLMDNVKSF